MKRKQFLSTAVLGTTAISLGQVSCRNNDSKSVEANKNSGAINTNYRDRDWADLFLPIITDINTGSSNILDADRAERD